MRILKDQIEQSRDLQREHFLREPSIRLQKRSETIASTTKIITSRSPLVLFIWFKSVTLMCSFFFNVVVTAVFLPVSLEGDTRSFI